LSIEPAVLLKAFVAGDDSPPLFDPAIGLANEAVSLVHMSLLSVPALVELIAATGHLNMFLYFLATAAQSHFDKARFCHLHSIIISTILLIAVSAEVTKNLNGECPNGGSLADFLINVLLNICCEQEFWPSFACVLHMVAPHVSTFSVPTAERVSDLFELVLASHGQLAPVFIEAFAAMLQGEDASRNGFGPALLKRGRLIRSVKEADRAMPIVAAWLKAAKASKKRQFTRDEMAATLSGVKVVVGDPVAFQKHSYMGGGR
jgi:hypothetical protein